MILWAYAHSVAKEYKPPKMINSITSSLARIGIGRSVELTTIGRSSGEARSVPVSPITIDGIEYIVSPYGSVGWVRNTRANPIVTIRRGRSERSARLVEVTGDAAAVVAAYYERESFPRRYMDLPDDPELGDFEEDPGSFPVFRVEV